MARTLNSAFLLCLWFLGFGSAGAAERSVPAPEKRQANATLPPYLPGDLVGVWETTSCRQGVGPAGGAFLLSIDDRRHVSGWFSNASDNSAAPFRGNLTRQGLLRGRIKPLVSVRGILNPTNPELSGVLQGRCFGTFRTVTTPTNDPPDPPDPPVVTNQFPNIPDPNLVLAIRNELNLPDRPITFEDLGRLPFLQFPYGLRDLTGLEHATNIYFLTLSGNPITNYTAIYCLPKLQFLTLGTGLTNLAFMTNFVQVQDLTLFADDPIDLSPLSGITNISSLNLHNSGINDLSGLAAMTHLEALDLYFISAADLSPLNALTNLYYLTLGNLAVSNYAAVGALPALRYLQLSGCPTPLAQLPALPNLTGLRIEYGCDVNLGPLATSTNLERLDFWYSSVTNLSVFNAMSRLESVASYNTPIRDPWNIGVFKAAKYLTLDGAEATDVSPFLTLTNVQSLSVSGNPLTNAPLLSNATWLASLSVTACRLTNIDFVAPLTGLKSLSAALNQIGNISPLTALTNLEYLVINFNPVTNHAPLAQCPALTSLEALDTGMRDTTFLLGLPQLQSASLSDNQITNLTFGANTVLSWFYVSQNELTDISPLLNLPSLRWTDVSLNRLDLSAGSTASNVVSVLRARGVDVTDHPQK